MPYPKSLRMTNKELFYFTCRCLSLDDHPEFRDEIVRRISEDNYSRNFVKICSNHWLLPAIYVKFKTHEILSQLPSELSEFLEEVHHLNVLRNERILKQVKDIILLLNHHDIFPTLLKGAGNLVDQLYSDIGERMMGDIDMLVPEKDYLRSARLLENSGYFHNSPDFFEVRDMKHYPRLYKKGEPADVEIHRLPVQIEYTKMYNTELIDQEKKSIGGEFSCYVLSDNHKVIHNFIHSQLSNNGHKHGVIPIRDLYDLYLLSKRTILSEVYPFIQHQKKAVTYFLFAGKIFDLPDFFAHKPTLTYRLFCFKNELFFKYYTLYQINKSTVYLSDRLYKYIKQFIEFFYSDNMRKSLIKRLSNRHWYVNHINTYRNFFSAKK